MGIRRPDWTNLVPPLEGTRPSRRVERQPEEEEKKEQQDNEAGKRQKKEETKGTEQKGLDVLI